MKVLAFSILLAPFRCLLSLGVKNCNILHPQTMYTLETMEATAQVFMVIASASWLCRSAASRHLFQWSHTNPWPSSARRPEDWIVTTGASTRGTCNNSFANVGKSYNFLTEGRNCLLEEGFIPRCPNLAWDKNSRNGKTFSDTVHLGKNFLFSLCLFSRIGTSTSSVFPLDYLVNLRLKESSIISTGNICSWKNR